MTIKQLQQTKKELYKTIIALSKKGEVNTETFKENLSNLLEIRYQLAIKKEFKQSIGVEISIFYQKESLFTMPAIESSLEQTLESIQPLNQIYKNKMTEFYQKNQQSSEGPSV
ncbi:hypothetical protein MOW07_08825 [Enterococcus hirae]|uniref:hypothetical protein n=1 Tax=Enterococcus hirae TaxID=1354 RepID=UPI0013647772|nr:hypothetical protein [Enterococcus hirae]EMF0167990.1 hypothetical protein [Enterococcus hirae]EMF0422200.1 hypothetical protein [Enterococcus hirae]MCD4956228.1 hypothetical protein [Enterococcus hirae]MDT2651804.1 hypothetical protein [Enterococcus hirae]NBJ42322.1 hypothetical protein [Enterococcus hirae]